MQKNHLISTLCSVGEIIKVRATAYYLAQRAKSSHLPTNQILAECNLNSFEKQITPLRAN